MENQTQTAHTELVAPSALEQLERAQTDIQISTAKRYPRPDLSIVKKKMVSMATLDTETASACMYALYRKGRDGEKAIKGPSIRLAEIALACYQNIRAGARIISNDGKNVIAQGVCHDLENNVYVSVEVKRKITGRDGNTFSEDMQTVTGNAACAIALRNAVFKVIPGALVKPVYETAAKVAVGDQKTITVRRAQVFDAFAKMGVSKDRVLKVVERASVEDVDAEDLELLIGLGTAIKDGEQKIDDAFPIDKPKPNIPGASPLDTSNPDLNKKPVSQPEPSPTASEGAQPPAPSAPVEPEKPLPNLDEPYPEVMKLLKDNGISEAQMVAYAHGKKLMKPEQTAVGAMSSSKLRNIVVEWDNIVNDIKAAKAE